MLGLKQDSDSSPLSFTFERTVSAPMMQKNESHRSGMCSGIPGMA
ncbi:MAG: hypothetical protein BSOLF_0592 [Candidatus Carbobacillus altaicus]|uniref:Uncharacterized protein n=1 Tax=Candidatus Carbonibacillus altaicus TaxID=2163959 RepID=A0A2R6Y0N5_9BACL|nr:MAG: hypothetical protein BSOLF_0592 [Candidatus Carbobacillus altaicus]